MSEAEILVDGRGLEHPEPLERVLAALETLQADQRLRFLIHRRPYPLLDILQRHSYRFEVTALDDGNFEVLIES